MKLRILSTVITICLALLHAIRQSCQCDLNGLLYEANLDTGMSSTTNDPKLQGFSVVEDDFSQRSSRSPCSWKGRLMITLPPAINGVQRRALVFKFTYATSPSGLGFPSFHIGDSKDNEALDIPISSTTHSAEVFNDGLTVKVHANREPGRPPVSPYGKEPNFIDPNHDTTVIVGHEFMMANDGNGKWMDYNGFLFSLNGDPPQTGVPDYRVYLGMNQLIKEQASLGTGRGLCKVKIFALTCNDAEIE